MAGSPRFVPNGYLVHPGYFGKQEDVQWKLATDLRCAQLLAHSIEQHELALAIHLRLKRDRTSVADVAVRFRDDDPREGAGLAQLWRNKLKGRVPAKPEDLTLWSWLTGIPRKNFDLKVLLDIEITPPRFPPAR
ncbi:MAG: hypothetical protein M0Z42_08000 [Actinomycetota bacterium]|jgi:hypothetical protein|nr:hypothetical protein [Actinomycetota bacterium]